MTEQLHFHFSLSCIGEGNGNPLQYSCLENPRDRGAWWAAVYGVAQSQTRLKWLNSLAAAAGNKKNIKFFQWVYDTSKILETTGFKNYSSSWILLVNTYHKNCWIVSMGKFKARPMKEPKCTWNFKEVNKWMEILVELSLVWDKCFIQWFIICVHAKLVQSSPTLCHPVDHNSLVSSVNRIL